MKGIWKSVRYGSLGMMASAIFLTIQGCDYKEVTISLLALVALLLAGGGSGGAGLEGIQVTSVQLITDSFGGVAAQDVMFQAIVNNADDATDYSWSFGDGQTGSGQTVTHRYVQSGTFHVKLTVNRNGAEQAFTTTFQIKSAMPAALSNLYWTEANPFSLNTCPVDNCNLSTTVTLATSNLFDPLGVVVAQGNIYWANVVNNGSIGTCPVNNCNNTTTSIVTTVPDTVAGLTATGSHLYWIEATGTMQRCPIASCNDGTVSDFITAGPPDRMVFATGSHLYWNTLSGELWRCALVTCSNATADQLLTTLGNSFGIVVTSDAIFITDTTNNVIWRCPLANCTDGTVAQVVTGLNKPYGITTTDTDLYWGNQGTKQIMTCPINNCSNATTSTVTSTVGILRGITVGP